MKRNGFELTAGIVTLTLSLAALVLFCLSYTTGYYIFGQMQSGIIAALLGTGIAVEIAAIVLRSRLPGAMWPKFLTFAVTALLAGDRVEGIGNCIITDYDSGHGGEEAIYMSLAASILMLAAMIYNIIGSFGRDKSGQEGAKRSGMARWAGFGTSALAVLLAVLIPTVNLVKPSGPVGSNSSGGTQSGDAYAISFNQNNGNAETMPDYQFLCCNLGGMVRADSRLFIDISLTLGGNGSYALFSEAYVLEGGRRAEIGDDTGLGLILTTNAEGTYVTNADGTITTSVPSHVVFEMQTDTYSAQMKSAAGMVVNGSDTDGVYDSNDEPAVLDFVPETIWTLSNGTIESYRNANAGGTFTVTFNVNNDNLDNLPDYQFLASDLSGMMMAESRLFVDVSLTLDGSGSYTLFSDAYVIESGNRAVIGDDGGLGMILTMKAAGSYTENENGTVTTSVPSHANFEMQWDTYSAQLRDALGMNVGGSTEGTFDSAAEPIVLDFVPETVWTLDGGSIVTWAEAGGEMPSDEPDNGLEAASDDGLTIPSDDGATTMTFHPDGTYVFAFAAYGIEDAGTYTYDGGVLTVTNANGAEATAEGDPLKLHYVASMSDQLTGDFTIPAADLTALHGEAASVTIPSDDGATTMTFNPDGTYVFAFAAYGIEDAGTYTYDGGVLTVTNANGAEVTAEGDPLKLHYVASMSDQLTGDFTIPAADLAALHGEAASVTIPSDDGATTMTFHPDGTYVFAFAAYGIEDAGTYTYDGGVLTVTNANGAEVTAEGDPLKLHYVASMSDQLTGDFTIPAADLTTQDGEAASVTIPSDDGATTMTFHPDGTYVFAFAAYGIEDAGTYTYDGGVLTVTNANGAEVTAEGDPLKLHYVASMSDQLTGDFTIPVADIPQ